MTDAALADFLNEFADGLRGWEPCEQEFDTAVRNLRIAADAIAAMEHVANEANRLRAENARLDTVATGAKIVADSLIAENERLRTHNAEAMAERAALAIMNVWRKRYGFAPMEWNDPNFREDEKRRALEEALAALRAAGIDMEEKT